MAVWYQDPITQAHGVNGEQGVDLGTPFHTTLTEILGGTVQRVDCSAPWACEIDVSTMINGQSYVEGYLHVDQPFVSVGQQLSPGQDIGLSGGEITALPGAQHIDSPSVSTGPHVEYDLWRGTSPWQGAIDPTAIVQAGPGVGGPPSIPDWFAALFPGTGQAQAALTTLESHGVGIPGLPSLPSLPSFPSINLDPFAGLGSGLSNFGNWIHDRAVPFAGANLIALIVAAAVIVIIFGTGSGEQSGGNPMPIPVPV